MIEYLLYLLLYGLSRVVNLAVLYRIAEVLMPVCYVLNRDYRRIAYSNVSKAFPHYSPSEVTHTVRKIFLNFGYNVAEFFILSSKLHGEWKSRVEVVGLKHIDRAREKGKGAIIVTGHIGNWELGAEVAAVIGYPVNCVFNRQTFPGTDRIFRRLRAKAGVRSYSLAHALWPISRALARNELVCLGGDRVFRGHALTADYFGRPAEFPAGPARLAARKGTPTIPAVMIRKRRGHFKLVFGKPFWPEEGDEESKAQEILNNYVRFLEKFVMETPEQWCNFGRQWPDTKEKKQGT